MPFYVLRPVGWHMRLVAEVSTLEEALPHVALESAKPIVERVFSSPESHNRCCVVISETSVLTGPKRLVHIYCGGVCCLGEELLMPAEQAVKQTKL